MYQMQIIRLTQIDIAKHILFYYFDEIIIFNSCGDMVSKKKTLVETPKRLTFGCIISNVRENKHTKLSETLEEIYKTNLPSSSKS